MALRKLRTSCLSVHGWTLSPQWRAISMNALPGTAGLPAALTAELLLLPAVAACCGGLPKRPAHVWPLMPQPPLPEAGPQLLSACRSSSRPCTHPVTAHQISHIAARLGRRPYCIDLQWTSRMLALGLGSCKLATLVFELWSIRFGLCKAQAASMPTTLISDVMSPTAALHQDRLLSLDLHQDRRTAW